MEDWTDIIKARVDQFREKTTEINNTFKGLLNELQRLNYSVDVSVDYSELIWEVKINSKTVSITYDEIIRAQSNVQVGENHNLINGEPFPIREAIIKLILNRFKWLPEQI